MFMLKKYETPNKAKPVTVDGDLASKVAHVCGIQPMTTPMTVLE